MILHIDMDAFYASVEERDRPELKTRPVVVGGTANRGVVSAANYIARRFGIHSAMPSVQARHLCPRAVFIKPRHQHYAAVARQIREIFFRYTPLVEPLSLDEAFLDVTASRALYGPAEAIGRRIKTEIKNELDLVASVGVAPNKFLAKLASDLQKPDGFVIIPADQIQAILDPLPVSRLWGVGKASVESLNRLAIHTVADIRDHSEQSLSNQFGKWGKHIWRLAHGVDSRSVHPDHLAKSISHEMTFPSNIIQSEPLESRLLIMTEDVCRRLRRQALLARRVTIKWRYADFRTFTRSQTLAEATDLTRDIWCSAQALFRERTPKPLPPLRLLGVGASDLLTENPRQLDLFAGTRQSRLKKIDLLTDKINERFGSAAIGRGRGFDKSRNSG